MNRIKGAAAAAVTAALVPGILVLGATTANAEPRPGHDNSGQTVAPQNKAQIERWERIERQLDGVPATTQQQPAAPVESSTASDVSMVQLGLGAAAGAALAGGVAGAIYLRGRRQPQPMQTA